MKRFYFLFLLFFIQQSTAQVSQIYADSTKLSGRGTGHNELIIENGTKAIKGFLYNYTGTGRTKYKLAVDTIIPLTDSTIRVRLSDASFFDIRIRGNAGNQLIIFTASNDISGSASGTTSLLPSLTVTGLRGSTLPSLSTGFLKY